ncbi:hypothetical protein HYH02_006205 [Chlamydomonas schloesseri]|uniref:IQCH-like ATP-grasp domain-containing protein n=1 Tax=Chlamydomonas schloesseri TaxID=2026947 RepID=A0A836B6M6_9CHLO|nr:hypothetical protein HYH02_006205 [Chlamydomonas schloesseri]|eukprot:KAG2448854.1 hypothetical protein HYH02_006205 [Chlamydomonas schloesseri]
MEQQGLDPHEVTDVLQQALVELKRVKQQLAKPYATRTTVAASIARLEDDIRRQAVAIAQATGIEAQISLPPASTQPVGLSFTPKAPTYAATNNARLEQFLAARIGPNATPITDTAKQYLQERFTAPPPAKPALNNGTVVKGRTSTAAPGVILPRHMREDPHGLAPPEVTDLELDKGLFHLVNRGLLPQKVDLTPALCGQAGPYRTAPAAKHPYHQQFERGPVTSALEDALQAKQDFKLDLITPVIRPQQEPKQATLHVATLGGGGVLGSPRPPHSPAHFQQGEGGGVEPAPASRGGAADAGAEAAEAALRPFEALMDTFSLHEVLIRKGVVIRETPEFESYARTYEGVWGVVEGLLQHLAALCAQYMVPLAVVNGKSLADLAIQVASAGYAPAMEDLLVCLTNIQEVAALLKQPGRRFMGPGGADAAAQLIQSFYRGHLARRKYSVRGQATLKIQHAWKNSRLRQQLRQRMRMARLERDMRFAELRDQLEQQWPLFRRNAHVVVHVPNLLPPPLTAGDVTTRPEPHLLNTMLLREAAQLARLCDLSEPLLDLILVLPSPPDADVIHYWNKLLEVGGVSDPTSRYRIVVPENHARLPGHMSVTAKLLASPRALKRIAAAVHGRLAYIVPGNVHDEEVELAVHLGVPLLGPSPAVCRALGRKSAARELFKTIAANIAPGCSIRSDDALRRESLARQQPGAASSLGTAASTSAAAAAAATGGRSYDPLTTPLRAGTDYRLGPDGELLVVDPSPQPPGTAGTLGGASSLASAPAFAGPGPGGTGMGSGTGVLGGQQQQPGFPTGSGAGPGPGAAGPQSKFEQDELRILMPLAECMVRHPAVPKWLFKVDDEVMGLGHAFFDTAAIKGGAEVLARVVEEAAGAGPRSAADSLRLELGLDGLDGGGDGAGDKPLTEVQRVAMFRMYELLFRQLPKRLHLACRDSYPTYRDYVTSLARRGGVLEGCPHMAVGSPCVNLFIDPRGNVSVLSTHEKIFCYPYRAVGTTFPQSSVPHRALYDAALAVGRSAFEAGLVGHAMVDFVTLLEPAQQQQQAQGAAAAGGGGSGGQGGLRLWLVDLKPGIMPSLMAFQLFDFLAAGAFNPMTGAYLVELDPVEDSDLLLAEATPPPPPLGPAAAGAGAAGASPLDLAAALPSSAAPQSLRYYFVLDSLQHPAVKAMPCSKFFYHCWQQGFHFDVDHRQGVIFNLSDRYLTSGALGCMAVGLTPSSTYGVMHRVLGFITGMDVSAGSRTDWALTPEATTFQDVQALVKYMAEQSATQERESRAGQAAAAAVSAAAGR